MNSLAKIWHEYQRPIVLGAGAGVAAIAIVAALVPARSDADLATLLSRGAEVARIDDNFVPFGLATAYRESRFNTDAVNDAPSEAARACELYHASADLFADNRYGADAFCWGSGGLFGFMPATGLKPKAFRTEDPRVVLFEPPAAVAMFADYVRRIVTNYFPNLPADGRTWLAVRRSMASLATMYDPSSQRARDVEARLAHDLAEVGYDPDLMYDRPRIYDDYPGAGAVWESIR